MLAAGVPLQEVLASFLGTCSEGRLATATWLQQLSTLPTLAHRRRVLEHFLRTFERAELHGTQWRATGQSTYVGRQHEGTHVVVVGEAFDMDTGEIRHETKVRPKHCPAARAGGLSARSGRSPRTLHRYRAELRELELIGSAQPPNTASDARRASNGQWAYAQHWLRQRPTPEMRARWAAWGKRRKRPVRRVMPAQATQAYTSEQAPRVSDLDALGAWAERRD